MRRQWETEDLIDQWTLHAEERALLGNKTGATRLGFAVLLKYFQRTGRFPQHKNEVPGMVITYLATQVDVNAATYLQYDWQGRTIEYHRAQIRTALGFREASVVDGEIMSQWLAEHVLPHEHQEDMVRQSCYQHFRLQHLEPPKPDRITRIIRSAYRSFETRLYETTVDSLDEKARAALDVLLIEASPQDADQATNEEPVTLHTLRMDPGQVGVETVLKEVAKLQQIRALGLPKDLFSHLSPKVLRSYRQRASAEAPSHLRAHPEAIRYTLLAALCWQRNQEITDSLVDLLIQLVHRIGARAERKVEEVYVAELKRVIGKESILYHIADAAVKQPDGLVRDVVFPVASETLLQDLIKEYESKGPVFRRQVHLVMRSSYRSHYRRILPHLLDVLEFHCNNELYQPIIRAVTLVKDYVHSPRQYYPEEEIVPIKDIVKAKWRDLVVEKDEDGTEKVNRINYEVCLLQALRDKVRSKEIWVVGANRYQNPDLDLPTDFEQQRTDYYEALKQPTEASAFVEQVRTSQQEALRSLDAAMPRLSPKVKILTRRNGWIHLSPLEAQPEPTNLARLKLDVAREWPMTSLLDMLKETDLQVGFTDLFTSISQREILPRETLQKRVLLCLYGLGTNTGLKRLVNADPGTTYQDLRYARSRYIHKEQLRNAIGRIANAIFAARKAEIWGEGTTACASDSKKFGAWNQNLLTEWHIRYRGPGIMVYWHVEKKSTCIYSQVKSCSSSEVAAMIEGILRHCTDAEIQANYVDSHGQSEVAFAFCHLLGFRLLPRLKDIGSQRLYRAEKGNPEEFANLQPVLTRAIDWDLITNQYDELIKYATALRLGTADAESILRRFTRNNVQHPTYRALAELGKAMKTIFLCEYLQSEDLRREIHEGLNVVENWNSANGFIFYGRSGEIATNRLDDQEVAVLSLHLLQICLVYINTLMVQQVLSSEQWKGKLTVPDYRGLSPLFYSHVNPYGTFRLDMNERLRLEA